MNERGGRIRDEDIEEVRRRANLIDVASEYMQVRKAGRLYKALCPFHAEKTPSLSLDPVKNLFHCFGCSEGGDTIALVRKLENLSFVETVERLAGRFGVELRYEQLSAADRNAMKRRLRLVDAHRAAVALYHRALMTSSEAVTARTYLKGRGFTKETVERFQLGFSGAKRDECARALRAAGFSEDEVVEAGLGYRAEGGGLVDRFRGRVMFPIFDLTGDPVAFGARKLADGDGPKYLNSAESPIYKKSQILYALNWAKNDIVKGARALLVEGYTDVIALHQAGITQAVATCGTALGLDHLRTIQRFTQNVVLSLDADEAGSGSAEKTYDALIGDAQALGLAISVVVMPEGDDPADVVAKGGGEAFGGLLAEVVPLLQFRLRRFATSYTRGDADARARSVAQALEMLHKTDNEVVRRESARLFANWIHVDEDVLQYQLQSIVRSGSAPRSIAGSVLKVASTQVRREREALKLAIQHAPMVKKFLEDMGPEFFSVPSHQAIWSALVAGADPLALADALSDLEARRAFTELAVQPPVGEVTDRLVTEIFGRLKESVLGRQIDELKSRLQRVNPVTDAEHHEALFAQLIELERAKRRLGEETVEEDR